MPQLDTSTFITQIFWLMLCFSSIFITMRFLVVPKLANLFTERLERIDVALKKIEQMRQETRETLTEYNELMHNTREEISTLLEVAREKASKEINAARQEIDEEIRTQLEASASSIEETKQEIIHHIPKITQEIFNVYMQKIIEIEIDEQSIAVLEHLSKTKH